MSGQACIPSAMSTVFQIWLIKYNLKLLIANARTRHGYQHVHTANLQNTRHWQK